MNEKEVKEAARLGKHRVPTCSVSGRPCECLAGGGCKNREPLLDRCDEEALRSIRTAHLMLNAARDWLIEAEDSAGGFGRRYPLPEARQWRREIDTIMRDIEGVLK